MKITELSEQGTTIIFLLKEEVAALRSVLSEWDTDKSCYLQWQKAENLRHVLEDLE